MTDKKRLWPLMALWICLGNISYSTDETIEPLSVGDKHPEISQRVARIIEDLHYARPRIDNSLSSAILDRYLDTLDGNRLYFLQKDYNWKHQTRDLNFRVQYQMTFSMFVL